MKKKVITVEDFDLALAELRHHNDLKRFKNEHAAKFKAKYKIGDSDLTFLLKVIKEERTLRVIK